MNSAPVGSSRVFQLERAVLCRFESKVKEGTGFIYNVTTGVMKTTDMIGYLIARRMRFGASYEELAIDLRARGFDLSEEALIPFVNRLVAEKFAFEQTGQHASGTQVGAHCGLAPQ